MICPHCQKESNPASRICPDCGQYMGRETPVARASRPAAFEEQPSRPRRAVKSAKPRSSKKRRQQRVRDKAYKKHRINWAMTTLVMAGIALILAAGVALFLKLSPQGQLIMARAGRDANADALFALGTEYLDHGYVEKAISSYALAVEKDPERPDIIDKYLLLGEAFEANGDKAQAEGVYRSIYETLDPKSPVGYRQVIRLMLADETRQLEAVELLKTAYEATGDESFFNERSKMLPQPPTASLSSGRYLLSRTVSFISPQDYDIYYTTSADAELPVEGELYTEPIKMEEGSYVFRAVCMASELVSDEMKVNYTITLPVPMAPRSNLASGAYPGRRSVHLRSIDEDKNLRFYYTIDGSPATIDSPEYTGEAIRLGVGKVFLRAIAVNSYGKRSTELNTQYDIKGGFKKYFRLEDGFNGFSLMKTTKDQFVKAQGMPDKEETVTDDTITGVCTLLSYPWGEARFVLNETGTVLYRIDTTATNMRGPRGVTIGMPMTDVIPKFRDMEQLPNPRGDRGIYYDQQEGYARYTVASDDPLEGLLRYVSFTTSPGVTTTTFDMAIKDGKVQKISLSFADKKVNHYESPY